MIKAIIFDCNGVFVENGLKENLETFSKEFGFDIPELKPEYLKLAEKALQGQITSLEVCQALVDEFRINATAEDVKKVWVETFVYEPDNEMYLFARELSKKYKICLFTNYSDIFDEVGKRLRLDQLFDKDMVFISSEIGMIKPQKEAFEYVLSNIGYKPEEVVFVDDNKDNVIQAKEMGIRGILFENVGRLKEEMLNLEKIKVEGAPK